MHTGGERIDVGHLWKADTTLSLIRILGPHGPQPCFSCSPQDTQQLLLYLACATCENIYCKSKWVYSAKGKCVTFV